MEDDTIEDLNNIINLSNIPANLNDTSIMTLTVAELDPPNDSIPLVFPDLIDWDEPEKPWHTYFPR